MPRSAATVLALALTIFAGCSGSDDANGSADKTTIQARELPVIWAEVLIERDRIQAATAKGYDMWHDDCATVAAAASRLDTLATEMAQRVSEIPTLGDRRNGIQNLLGTFGAVINGLRTSAMQETVGDLPKLMLSLDAFLRGLEGHFTPDEIGSESVSTHPGFDPLLRKPAISPI